MQPNQEGTDLEMIDDGLIVVAENGTIDHAGSVEEVKGQWQANWGRPMTLLGGREQLVIMPTTVDTHDHSSQPLGIPGELIMDNGDGEFSGWLPDTLRQGELRAKGDPALAYQIALSKLHEFRRNGIGMVLEYTTSSVEVALATVMAAQKVGIRVRAGYVAMDQKIDNIAPGLQTTGDEAVRATREFLEKAGRHGVVIDRFPIAVSSETRRRLAELAREFGVLYETHCAESVDEKDIHNGIYGTKSIVETLDRDGVFAPGGKVGLAHMIHLNKEEIDLLGLRIKQGCEISVRACPNSNQQLGSHWDSGIYMPFPLRELEQAGAIVTLGTDQGAGRNSNIFREMLDERGRHEPGRAPSNVSLLKYGILNGYRSLGVGPEHLRMKPGVPAEFMIVRMAGAGGFYKVGDNYGDIESTAARVIEGGQTPDNIHMMYVGGKRVK